MKISIIGLSGSGKSYWAKRLQEENGFRRFCCDDLIEQKLRLELDGIYPPGLPGLAAWMGEPYESRHQSRSQQYLDFERMVMEEIYELLQQPDLPDENIVLDTTGSVIYTNDWILKTLTELTRVVYLDTPLSAQEEMYRLYLADPKPVIWNESFQKLNGEADLEALQRSYRNLLVYRSSQYEKLAEVTLDYSIIRDPNFSADKFIELITE